MKKPKNRCIKKHSASKDKHITESICIAIKCQSKCEDIVRMHAEERFFVIYFFFKFESVVIEVFLKFEESEELAVPGLFFSIGLSDNLN